MLYNELQQISYDDLPRLRQVIARLERLLRLAPDDVLLRLGLADSYARYGDAPRATHIVDSLWRTQEWELTELRQNYALILIRLGLYDRFIEFVSKFQELEPPLRPGWLPIAAFQAYWRLGDLSSIVAMKNGKSSFIPFVGYECPPSLSKIFSRVDDVQNLLEKLRLLNLFQNYQLIISNRLLGRQISCSIEFQVECGNELEASTTVYIAGSYSERVQIEDQLRDELDEFVEHSGGDVSGARTFLPVYLLPVSTVTLNQAA